MLVFGVGLGGFASVRGIGGRLGVTYRIVGLDELIEVVELGVEDGVEGLVFDFGVR